MAPRDDQNCYFNSYESTYTIMIMGVMTVQGFYFRMPPYGYLLEVSDCPLLRFSSLPLASGSYDCPLPQGLIIAPCLRV